MTATIQWHDLRVMPTDLPKATGKWGDSMRKIVSDKGEIVFYDNDCRCFRDEYGLETTVRAWTELPRL